MHQRGLLIGAAAAVFLTLSGAFGGDHEPFAMRLGYWAVLMVVGNLASIIAIRLVRRIPAIGGPVAQWAVATVLLTPLSAMVWGMNGLMFGYWFDAAEMVRLAPNILLVAGALTAINFLADRPLAEPLLSEPRRGARPPLLQRLPFKLGGAAIRAVQAEDHYLRVHTDAGDALILMRLTDAVVELGGLDGARTHRSWWVARDAVVSARRKDGRAVLELAGGLEAPVSRSFARGLREEGWF